MFFVPRRTMPIDRNFHIHNLILQFQVGPVATHLKEIKLLSLNSMEFYKDAISDHAIRCKMITEQRQESSCLYIR